MTAIRTARERLGRDDTGFGLAETLVAAMLLLVVLGITFTAVASTARASKSARISNDSNEEARIMLTRMAREMREAQAIVAVTNPGATGTANAAACDPFNPNADVSVTFDVDFNGDGTIEPGAADPEELTYTYDHVTHRVTESAAGQSYPVLAGNVSAFKLTYTSRSQQYDGLCDAQHDGVVYWSDIDKSAVGNASGTLDTANELNAIDSVTIQLSMQGAGSSAVQTYRTQVDLRNAAA